jgi:hypothetical protein
MEQNKNHNDAPEPQPTVSPEHRSNLFAKLKGNKWVWIVAGVVVLAVAGVVAMAMTGKDDPKQSTKKQTTTTNTPGESKSQSKFVQQFGQGCEERDVKFTSAPMKMEELAFIRPLGAVSDGHVTPTDHVYIGGSNMNAKANSYAVLMPADGTVTQVSAMPDQYIGDRQGQQTASEDHHIVISHSCRYYTILIHVNGLGDKLKSEVGTLQPNESKKTTVKLTAGEVIGYIGGSTFDWIPIDANVTLKGFMSPELYEGESWKIHTVSPFDLYEGELKTALEAKSMRTAPPVGGKIDYDVAGKLVGNWFREGTGGYTGPTGNNGGRYWDGHLSVAPDYLDPTYTVVSIGNWSGSAKQMLVSGSVDTAKVGEAEGMVKYELKRLSYVGPNGQSGGNLYQKGLHPNPTESVEGTILFQVLAGEKLKVEKFPGKTASQVSGFTAAAQVYER